VAEATRCQDNDAHWAGHRFNRIGEKRPEFKTPGWAGQRRLQGIYDDWNDGRQLVQTCLPQRNAEGVVQLQIIGEGRFETCLKHRLGDVEPKLGVAGHDWMGIFGQPWLGRTAMRIANANANRRHIIEEEICPVIGANSNDHIRPRGTDPVSELSEGISQTTALRDRVPFADNRRRVTHRENSCNLSHERAPGLLAVPR
jgi:hypothetical protein